MSKSDSKTDSKTGDGRGVIKVYHENDLVVFIKGESIDSYQMRFYRKCMDIDGNEYWLQCPTDIRGGVISTLANFFLGLKEKADEEKKREISILHYDASPTSLASFINGFVIVTEE